MKKLIIGIMLLCLVGSVFADSWIMWKETPRIKTNSVMTSNPITSRIDSSYINSMHYIDHKIAFPLSQKGDIYRCFEVNENNSGNCHLLKKPINVDNLPFNYWVH